MAMKSSNLLLALLALCTFVMVHAETDAQFLVTDLDPKKTYLTKWEGGKGKGEPREVIDAMTPYGDVELEESV